MKKLIFPLLLLGALLSFVACTPEEDPIEYSVSVKPRKVTVEEGETVTLKPSITPNAEGVVFSYESDDEAIATVTRKGAVTGVKEGKCVITITATIGSVTATAECKVTVEKATFHLLEHELNIYATTAHQLEYKPADLTVQWSSSNSYYATVTDGKVSALNIGECDIIAKTTYDGESVSDTCHVYILPYSVVVSRQYVALEIGGTVTLTAAMCDNSDKGAVTWSSSDETVATVNSNGVVTGVAPGTTYIAATIDTYIGYCTITVLPAPAASEALTVAIGQLKQITTNYDDCTFRSLDTSIATVDEYGKVTGVAEGECDIEITFGDRGQLTCHITVVSHIVHPFSVSATQQVLFSPGNLQYNGTNGQWKFADSQTEVLLASGTSGWFDLFCWGTGNDPMKVSTKSSYTTFSEWGNNPILNGSVTDPAGTWRTPNSSEIYYMLESRTDATQLRYYTTINDQYGMLLLPDDFLSAGFTIDLSVDISLADWAMLEADGAVFLPAGGYAQDGTYKGTGPYGYYWLSDITSNFEAYYISISYMEVKHCLGTDAQSVRLVRNVE